MPEFERNDISFIEKQIEENVKLPIIGEVVQVYEHTTTDDDSNWEVDLQVNGLGTPLQRVPVHAPYTDSIAPPKYGDKVLVIYTEGRTKRPVAFSTAWSNEDRPPLGLAGMYRNRFESGSSPAGDGSLHITGYTKYDESVASNDKDDLTPEETFVQIAKHAEGENVDPTLADDLPAKIEMYDSPSNDDAWIEVQINKENGSDSAVSWGMKFNIATGEWKIVGPSGFGITSDGSGNFVWKHKSIEFDEVSSSTGGLSL